MLVIIPWGQGGSKAVILQIPYSFVRNLIGLGIPETNISASIDN